MLLKMYLESEGFEVETARDGFDALAKLRVGLSPCLILLDILMDGMGGNEFLEVFERTDPERFASIPIIATSALETIPNAKVRGFLPKPVQLETLVETVQAHCGS